MKEIQSSEVNIIKEQILKTLLNLGASAQRIILFGSRARKNFTRFSDYDVLIIITDKTFEINKKMRISKNIREYLAKLGIDADVIIKSDHEVEVLKNKPGSVVRNALKEGVAI